MCRVAHLLAEKTFLGKHDEAITVDCLETTVMPEIDSVPQMFSFELPYVTTMV